MTNAAHRDAIGFRVFSAGDLGRLHVLAHQHLDRGDFQGGFRALHDLDSRRPSDNAAVSQWTHLHWHQLVFEIETGRIDEAHQRLMEVLLVSALRDDCAKTDAPAALWLLSMYDRASRNLPWDLVAALARRRFRNPESSFVAVHDLLAFAGARSESDLRRWIHWASTSRSDLADILPFACSLRDAVLVGSRENCQRLAGVAGQLRLAGGSAGQNRLFSLIANSASRLGDTMVSPLAA